jgi:hypothetical protein
MDAYDSTCALLLLVWTPSRETSRLACAMHPPPATFWLGGKRIRPLLADSLVGPPLELFLGLPPSLHVKLSNRRTFDNSFRLFSPGCGSVAFERNR